MTRFNLKMASALAIALAVSALATQPADARRGGSFGSRGSRTYYAPAPTGYSPGYVAPIQRSMTTRPVTAQAPVYAPAYAPQPFQRPPGSRFGGFGGGLLGGLLAGGLIGGLLGHGMGYGGGMGGGGGMLMALIQLALLGGIIWFVIGLFRRNANTGGANGPANGWDSARVPSPPFAMGYPEPAAPQPYPPQPYPAVAPAMASIAITEADKAAFERLLIEVQDAFGHEDYGRLRERTTPEVMSYLAEELSQNATNGLRNEVKATRLIDAQVSEAWNEDSVDYATIAMHYESIDVMHDRNTGAIVKGDPTQPTQTTELWTFVREGYAPWKLSAIQEV